MEVKVKFLMLVAIAVFMPSTGFTDIKAGEEKAQFCLLCHKPDFPSATLPTLEGQTREYIYNQIKAFKEKRRSDPTMQLNVAALSEKDVNNIADYFSSREPLRVSFRLDPVKTARGKSKAEGFDCASCHLLDFSGKKDIPRLAGTDPAYTAKQLLAFTEGKRSHPWIDGTRGITGADAEDLAQYFAELQ